MSNKKNLIRTRFAPSPTGNLHVGGARTALFNYLWAKRKKGSFVLRVEDTDKKRSFEKYSKAQFDDLTWLNITPDESPFKGGKFGPYQQKKRLKIYETYLRLLIKKKNAYYCFCNREELKREKKEYTLKEKKSNYKYSRKCFFLSSEEISLRLSSEHDYLIRFFVPKGKTYSFEDSIRGNVQFSSSDIEDFVICRRNGIPLLNFAVTVDDHLMNITHVMRAEEHLSNTAKQLALYECLGWKSPTFSHLSIILNGEKKKISKRDKENQFHSIRSLKQLGYLPQGILNYLAFLGWNPKSKNEFFSLKDMVKNFDISGFNSRSPIFSIEKLNWYNNYWIKKLKMKDYNFLAWNFLKKEFSLSEKQRSKALKISKLFKQELICFSDLPNLTRFFFNDLGKITEDISLNILQLIDKFFVEIISLKKWSWEQIRLNLNSYVQNFSKLEKKNFFLTIRMIITGSRKGPELFKVINLIGKRDLKKRIKKMLSK